MVFRVRPANPANERAGCHAKSGAVSWGSTSGRGARTRPGVGPDACGQPLGRRPHGPFDHDATHWRANGLPSDA